MLEYFGVSEKCCGIEQESFTKMPISFFFSKNLTLQFKVDNTSKLEFGFDIFKETCLSRKDISKILNVNVWEVFSK